MNRDAQRALEAYPEIEAPSIEPVGGGLIHASYEVRSARGHFVLQRLRPIFNPGIHENIRAVVEQLRRKGLTTPELVANRSGAWTTAVDDSTWRLWTWVEGACFQRCTGPAQAASAARLVARFHGALEDLEHRFAPLGITLHDPQRHLAELREALRSAPEHRLARDVRALADPILARAEALPRLEAVRRRPGHGDLKLSNLRFAGSEPEQSERAVALLDLDTLCELPLWAELGDAWRSWCNRSRESDERADLDTAVLEAALTAYLDASSLALEREERDALVFGLEWISLELAARFAVDALREHYFAWDPERFPAAGEHNLARARGQLSLHEQARDARSMQQRVLHGA